MVFVSVKKSHILEADALFSCNCHNLKHTVEIKCPYTKRDTKNINEAVLDKDFCLDQERNLKKTHRYYTQVQLQMFIYNCQECFFVVWTPQWVEVIKVIKDGVFLNQLLLTLETFYNDHIIPELLTRTIEKKIAADLDIKKTKTAKLYCICQSEYNDKHTWIGCDSELCKSEWFHLDCVKIKRIPKGSWYCPDCRKSKNQDKQLQLEKTLSSENIITSSEKFV